MLVHPELAEGYILSLPKDSFGGLWTLRKAKPNARMALRDLLLRVVSLVRQMSLTGETAQSH